MRLFLSVMPRFSHITLVSAFALSVLCSLALVSPTTAQVPREPDYEAMKNADQDGQNKQAVDRIKNEQKGKYRGGAQSFSEVKQNMERLQKPILLGQGGNVDKWYSPHLRDILMPPAERSEILPYRFMAGASYMEYIPFFDCWVCANGVGRPETACTICQPKGSAPGAMGCWFSNKPWFDDHITPTCCFRNTAEYLIRFTDANFKTCCVRNEDQHESTEEISCRHVDGSGWAGIFEYYYPTTIVGWENSRTTTMIADKNEVKQCVQKASSSMHEDKATSWVEKAIKKNLEVADKLEGSTGGSTDTSGLQQKIKDSLQVVNSIKQENQFADSLQGEGLTMRVNFPAMDPEYRRRLARHFCMREEQFMKLMDEEEDKLQRAGGKSIDQLRTSIPVWANYCPQAVQLMTDPDETKKCINIDQTETDFVKGMGAWTNDPLFCQRMNLANPKMQELFGETLSKSKGGRQSEAAVGYTCRDGGKLNGSMVPVELYRHTPIERRTAISDHVLGFLIAGALYGDMKQGKRSYYKRFEPRPYSLGPGFEMFRGLPFYGSGSGPMNEVDMPCEGVQPEVYTGRNKSDQLFISDQTHPTRAFTGETEMINEASPNEFNRYVQEWGKGGQGKTLPKRAVDDGTDDKSANYAVAFRIFATCPSKYTRWHPTDVHDVLVEESCGDENFGGNMTGVSKDPP